ncbi:MAG: hypothetical protein ABIP20_18790 [Chthoniobacteraceae bacterium]
MTAPDATRLIEVKVQTMHQLFNSMDPSPFHERDLDRDAEQFIVSWAQEHPMHTPLRLVVHLGQPPEKSGPQADIAESIHHYFTYRAELNQRDFHQLLREGWTSLLIGLAFLAVCVTIAQSIPVFPRGSGLATVMKEGFTIIGWVAMWRPLEIYLYRWWPIRHLGKIYTKLSTVPVEVRITAA